MIRNVALRFVFFIGFACALGGANPAHAVFADYATLYSQVQLILAGFTEKARLGGSTTESYLKLDDVRGSSTSSVYKDQIPVLFSQNYITTTGSSGAASPSDYYLVIPVDQSGPILEQAVASANPFVKATITNLRSERGMQVIYQTDTLEGVRVTFYMRTTTPIAAHPEVAIIGLSFAKATWVNGLVKTCRDFSTSKSC